MQKKMQISASINVIGLLGSMSFVVGFALAILTGWFWEDTGGLDATLVILGLVVGLINITGKEVIPYLVAAIALVVIGQGGIFTSLNEVAGGLGTTLNDIVGKLAIFAAPAAVVNALRAAVALARPGQAE